MSQILTACCCPQPHPCDGCVHPETVLIKWPAFTPSPYDMQGWLYDPDEGGRPDFCYGSQLTVPAGSGVARLCCYREEGDGKLYSHGYLMNPVLLPCAHSVCWVAEDLSADSTNLYGIVVIIWLQRSYCNILGQTTWSVIFLYAPHSCMKRNPVEPPYPGGALNSRSWTSPQPSRHDCTLATEFNDQVRPYQCQGGSKDNFPYSFYPNPPIPYRLWWFDFTRPAPQVLGYYPPRPPGTPPGVNLDDFPAYIEVT